MAGARPETRLPIVFGLVMMSWAAAGAACTPAVARVPQTTEAGWQAARARLDALRASEPDHPYGMVVRVTLREPRSGRVFDARGAIAVDPHRALRMILIGPGGATALDAWVTGDAYRFEVPPLGMVRRGGREADAGLPVDFFREWFLAPLAGRLLASFAGSSEDAPGEDVCAGDWFILRRGVGTLTFCDRAAPGELEIVGSRLTPKSAERLAFKGKSLTPHAGDHAEYEDARSGVRAKVEVESLDDSLPDPVAFLDPDKEGASPR
jgi:hypothetical protein